MSELEEAEEASRKENERKLDDLSEEVERLRQDLAAAEIRCTDLDQMLSSKGTGYYLTFYIFIALTIVSDPGSLDPDLDSGILLNPYP